VGRLGISLACLVSRPGAHRWTAAAPAAASSNALTLELFLVEKCIYRRGTSWKPPARSFQL